MDIITEAKKHGLTEKQFLFCVEYLKDFNGVQAAIRAGYSEDSVETNSWRLRDNEGVQACLKALTASKPELTPARVLSQLVSILEADLTTLFDQNGCLVHPSAIPEDMKPVLSKIETIETFDKETGEHTGYIRKVGLWDKTKMIDLAMRHLHLLDADKDTELASSIERLAERLGSRSRPRTTISKLADVSDN